MAFVDISDKRFAYLETKKCIECSNCMVKIFKNGKPCHYCILDKCRIAMKDCACVLFKEGEKSEAI